MLKTDNTGSHSLNLLNSQSLNQKLFQLIWIQGTVLESVYPAVNKNIVYNGKKKISSWGLQRKQLSRVTEIAPGVS